MCPKPNFEINP